MNTPTEFLPLNAGGPFSHLAYNPSTKRVRIQIEDNISGDGGVLDINSAHAEELVGKLSAVLREMSLHARCQLDIGFEEWVAENTEDRGYGGTA